MLTEAEWSKNKQGYATYADYVNAQQASTTASMWNNGSGTPGVGVGKSTVQPQSTVQPNNPAGNPDSIARATKPYTPIDDNSKVFYPWSDEDLKPYAKQYGSIEQARRQMPTYLTVGELKNQFKFLPESQKSYLAAVLKMQGKKPTETAMRTAWGKVVTDAAQAYINEPGTRTSPWDLLAATKIDPSVQPYGNTGSNTGGPTTTRYLTDYFTSAGKAKPALNELFTKTLTDVLGRPPTAAEKREYSGVLSDMKKAQDSGLFTSSQTQGAGFGTSRPGADPATWLQTQVANKHQARIKYGKENAQQTNLDQYAQAAAEYGFSIFGADGKTLTSPAKQQLSLLEAGKTTMNDVMQSFKTAALAEYAYLKPQFDAGLTLHQIVAPAINSIANILEKDPNTVNVNDTLVKKYLQGKDGKGTMPLYEYESMLRKDPSWQYTTNAKEKYADMTMQLGERFGMVG
jgi:hypothetical protein